MKGHTPLAKSNKEQTHCYQSNIQEYQKYHRNTQKFHFCLCPKSGSKSALNHTLPSASPTAVHPDRVSGAHWQRLWAALETVMSAQVLWSFQPNRVLLMDIVSVHAYPHWKTTVKTEIGIAGNSANKNLALSLCLKNNIKTQLKRRILMKWKTANI